MILHIWRQRSADHAGRLVRYEHMKVNPHMSFLEMLDVLNEDLIARMNRDYLKASWTARGDAAPDGE